MWRRFFEVADGHQTGRWQWTRPTANPELKEVYPGHWMFGDAICPPPGVGWCPPKTKVGDGMFRYFSPIRGEDDD